jgi:ribosomal protein L16 Arg81 hydroxylase
MDFAHFIAPLTTDEFFASYWPSRAFTRAEGPARADTIAAIPELADAETILSAFRQPVSVVRKQGPHARVERGVDAIRALRAGFTCYLKHVERDVPALGDLLDDASRVLGLPLGAMSCEVFCSNGPSGLPMHSDFDVNFALLLSGSKRWLLAENQSIHNQTSMCFAGDRPQPDPTQLTYAHAPFPDRMPSDATDVTIGAGGLVFVPRGWWHETFSNGECLQVNLVVKGPHWASVLTQGLQAELLGDRRWRAFAYGIAGDPATRDSAIVEFADLITGLRGLLDSVGPRELAERLLAATAEGVLTTGSSRVR